MLSFVGMRTYMHWFWLMILLGYCHSSFAGIISTVLTAEIQKIPTYSSQYSHVYPKYTLIARLANGDAVFASPSPSTVSPAKPRFYLTRWNAQGAGTPVPLPESYLYATVVDYGGGLLLVGGPNKEYSEQGDIRITWLGPKGAMVSARLLVPRKDPKVLLLSDHSVLVYGGTKRGANANALERIAMANGRLVVERLPDVPGPGRVGFALVELANWQIMAIGGDAGQYLGCSSGQSCTQTTYLLDVPRKRWQQGASLIEGRSNMSAALLPNGDVLVAGGWTARDNWQTGASKTVERWVAKENRWVPDAPLPNADAQQTAYWLPGEGKRHLLLLNGRSAAIQSYELSSRQWRTVATLCAAHYGPTYPIVRQGRAYMAMYDWGEGSAMNRCDGSSDGLFITPLRLPLTNGAPQTLLADPLDGLGLLRSGMVFLPASTNGPAWVLGGAVDNEDLRSGSSDVDALWSNNVVEWGTPTPLGFEPVQGFRLANQLIVIAAYENKPEQRREEALQRLLWIKETDLSQGKAWHIDAQTYPRDTRWGKDGPGNLLRFTPGGAVGRIPAAPEGLLTEQYQQFPKPLNRARIDNQESYTITVKGLADGRVIVAGGDVQTEKIALLNANGNEVDAADGYIGVGEFLGSRRHEIFDPVTQTWRNSAPSKGAGGKVAILDDGRVVKIGQVTVKGPRPDWPEDASTEHTEAILEISNAEGTAWQRLGKSQSAVRLFQDEAVPFVIDGELFLRGIVFIAGTGFGNALLSTVQWFNAQTETWETLWQGRQGDGWRYAAGRVIVRTLANGKTVVIPVAGVR